MKKYNVFVLITVMVLMIAGCGKNYKKLIDNHEATVMSEKGMWEERYLESSPKWDNENDGGMVLSLSVNVNQDMTEQEMLEVLDYYDLKSHYMYKGNKNFNDIVTNYAVFYKGDTDEEIMKVKYVNGNKEEYTEEEEYEFASPAFYNTGSEYNY